MDIDLPQIPIGRLRREGFYVWFGDRRFDVDELRSHFVDGLLLPVLRQFTPPPTAAECVWLMQLIDGALPWTRKRFVDGLLEIVNGHPR